MFGKRNLSNWVKPNVDSHVLLDLMREIQYELSHLF